jgi:hypothetical protein
MSPPLNLVDGLGNPIKEEVVNVEEEEEQHQDEELKLRLQTRAGRTYRSGIQTIFN